MLIKHGLRVLDKTRTARNGFKNDQSYELIDDEILKMHKPYSEKIKVKVYENQKKIFITA